MALPTVPKSQKALVAAEAAAKVFALMKSGGRFLKNKTPNLQGSAIDLREKFVKTAPRGIFNAMGGNKVPLLDMAFSAYDKRRLANREEKMKEREAPVSRVPSPMSAPVETPSPQNYPKAAGVPGYPPASGVPSPFSRHKEAHEKATKGLERDEEVEQLKKISRDTDAIRDLLESQPPEEKKEGGLLSGLIGMLTPLLGGLFAKLLPKLLAVIGGGMGLGARLLGGAGALLGAARGFGGRVLTGAGAMLGGIAERGKGMFTAGKARAAQFLASRGLIGTAAAGAAGAGVAASEVLPAIADDAKKADSPEKAPAAKDTTEKAGKEAAKEGAEKIATKEGAEVAGKTLGKSVLKKIPIIGALAGLGFAAGRAWDGDWTGAGMELTSGALSTLPGLGTAGSVAVDAALAARDAGMMEGTALGMNPSESQTSDSLTSAEKTSTELTPVSATSAEKTSEVTTDSDVLGQMLALMKDETKGIFVREAHDPFSMPVIASDTPRTPRTPTPQPQPASQPPTPGIRRETPIQTKSGEVAMLPTVTVTGDASQVEATPASFTRQPTPVPAMPFDSGKDLGAANQSEMSLALYDAAIASGMHHDGALALIGEIGRENSLRPDLIFGKHDDPHNAARNAGLISWQGDRHDALMKHLANVPGALNEEGGFNRNATNLRAQMEFFLKETHERGRGIGVRASDAPKNMAVYEQLTDPTKFRADTHENLGRDVIKWRIDDDYTVRPDGQIGYRHQGLENAEAFRNVAARAVASREPMPYEEIAPQSYAEATPVSDSARISESMQKESVEESVSANRSQPVVIQQPVPQSRGVSGGGGGKPASAPLITRTNDSAITRLTDNFIGHSMAIA